jgi:O-antigen ligase
MKKYVLYFAILILPLRNIVEKVPNIYGIDGLGFMNVLFLVLVLLAYSTKYTPFKSSGRIDYVSLPLSLYLLYFLFLVFLSINSYTSTWYRFVFWKDYFIGFSFYFIVIRFSLSRKEIFIGLVVMLVANLYMDLYFWRWVRWMNFASFDDRLKSVNGTFGEMGGPNEWAAFFSTYTLILIAVARRSTAGKILKRCLSVLVFCNILVMLFSFSRGAYLGFTVGLLYYCLKSKDNLLFVCLLVCVLFYTAIIPDAVLERISMTKTEEGFDRDAVSRLVMWQYALKGFSEHPIVGNGLLSYYFDFEGQKIFNNPHNTHLHILYEAGIVGYGLFLWIFLAAYKQSILLYKISGNNFYGRLGLGSASMVISLFVTNFFGNRWTYMCLIGYFWVILAIIKISLHQLQDNDRLKSKKISQVTD